MKVYKHDKYNDIILLAYPMFNKIAGIPYCYNHLTKCWERAGLGTALYFYDNAKLDTMECIGDTKKEWDFITQGNIDSSYLIDNRKTKPCKTEQKGVKNG